MVDNFPNCENDPFTKTSPPDQLYNCIAFACGITNRWMWPFSFKGYSYWPSGIPSRDDVPAFISLFESIGYIVCGDGEFEPGFEKVAIFADKNKVKHAARQLIQGSWTSKLGQNIDVVHSIEAMEGGIYGDVAVYMKRVISDQEE